MQFLKKNHFFFRALLSSIQEKQLFENEEKKISKKRVVDKSLDNYMNLM